MSLKLLVVLHLEGLGMGNHQYGYPAVPRCTKHMSHGIEVGPRAGVA
jgi:hypothetical protein